MGSAGPPQASELGAPAPRGSEVTEIGDPALRPEVARDRIVTVRQGEILALRLHLTSEADLPALYRAKKLQLDAELGAIAREYLGESTDIALSVVPGSLVARIVGRFWRSVKVAVSAMARRIKAAVQRFLELVQVGAVIMMMVGFQVFMAIDQIMDEIVDLSDRIARWFRMRRDDAMFHAIVRTLRRTDGGYGEGGLFLA